MMEGLEAAGRLAAIVFDRDENPDAPLAAFIEAAARRGIRVAGLAQVRADGDRRGSHDVAVRDLVTGEILPIMQDLGAEATGCSVDPAAIAEAARLLSRAIATRPDLLIVNRFGRLECEGGGMLVEIGQALADGIALIACVPKRYRDAWNAFAAGLDAQLPPSREAIEDWWTAVAQTDWEGSNAA
jgi:nucleoside-triphosphatase THEP1